MTTDKAIEIANKMYLSDNPLWLEVKRLACEYEKQIAVDSEHITALQKTNGYLTDRVNDLEAQIEKMSELINRYYEVCAQIPKELRTMVFDSCLEDTRKMVKDREI